jgi:RimJ/RimL family protein N-acetyltransferase
MTQKYEIEVVFPESMNGRRYELSNLIMRMQEIRVWSEEPRIITAIARMGAEIIGICDVSEESQDYGSVVFMVHPNYQGIGIGAQLVDRVILESRNVRLTRLRACVLQNTASEHIFQKLHFYEEPISQEVRAFFFNIPYAEYKLLL